MDSNLTAIDISRLPMPDVIRQVAADVILQEMLADLYARAPALQGLLPSDPLYTLLEVAAYRESVRRYQSNDDAKAVMVALATDADLDHLAALFRVKRLVLDPGDPSRGIAAVMERDAQFRRRIVLAPEGYSVAGPEGAYIYHAISAHADVLDVSATSPAPGEVVVTVLSRRANGQPSQEVLDAVMASVNHESVRPMTDHVTVQPAQITDYQVHARLHTYAGPDAAVVLSEAQRRVTAYTTEAFRLGRDIALSGLYAGLHVEGIQRVELNTPQQGLIIGRTQAARCTDITLVHGGVDE
ncbi:baseplate assembly protein [Xylella taiwanensis]|uniref:Baseplate J/gp47 family protein n=1 Tax=Xylella taiwanensis TaxID=1444770 RepID=Z9JKR7_9GAMM|nr:baseplate J/gp47 family protein [Xylella taiwanensis]AXI83130.1 baseplate assembly protein [Xylella taiwanensis]EWS78784.1 baseplate assembly protein [Xylella taiwanensis]MCD8456173.1 baseplate J/gp47 family protein [Xylella taiwanensis]MCD8458581.1 baseplate J/gp47 family protein [Xylella taiwanensis]MCD8460715.1 baseplate J/gp47 family protein [Xylella taiwanensis]